MTVQQVIDELSKVKDRNIQVFFDCPFCGHANSMIALGLVALVKTGEANPKSLITNRKSEIK